MNRPENRNNISCAFKHKYAITVSSLIFTVILLVTLSVLLLTQFFQPSPILCKKPIDVQKMVKNGFKQTFRNLHINYTAPYETQLDVVVQPGTEFLIIGDLLTTDKRFHIDLLSPSPNRLINRKDFHLHFNPRFNSSLYYPVSRDVIMLGSLVQGSNKWEDESFIFPRPFPIQVGKKFRIQIYCEDEQYRVSIDEVVIGGFGYRLPIENITSICFTGELQLDIVEIITP